MDTVENVVTDKRYIKLSQVVQFAAVCLCRPGGHCTGDVACVSCFFSTPCPVLFQTRLCCCGGGGGGVNSTSPRAFLVAQ